MKLHLPTGLRAALIAAFAVAGTLAQAGITTYDVTTWSTYDQSAGAAVVGNGTAQKFDYSEMFNNNWSFVVTVTADSIKGDSALTLLALSLQQQGGTGLGEGITLADNGSQTATLTSWSSAAAGGAQTLDLTDVTDLTFVLSHSTDKNLTMKVYADNNFSSAIATATQGGQSFSNTTVDHVALGGTGGMNRYAHNNNQVTFPDDATTGTFEITKAGYLFDAVITENDLIKYYTPPSTLVWNSTSSATWDLSTPNWVAEGEATPIVFVDYATAVFGSGSSLVKNIEVDGPVNVDVMNVQANYTFTAGSGSILMVDTLNVANGMTATLAGEGDFSVSHLAGAVSIASGASLTLDGTITLNGTQTLPVSGEGRLVATTLQVTGGSHTITNALEVTGGGDGTGSGNRSLGLAVTNAAASVTLAGATNITGALYAQVGTVNIGNGTDAVRVETNRVEFGDTAGNGTSTLNVNKNATLRVKAGDVANAYASTGLVMGEWGGVSVANIAGKLYAQNATAYVGDNQVTFNIQEGGLMAVKGFAQNETKDNKTETINLNLLDGGTLVMGASGITNQKPVIINFAAGEVGISETSVEIAKDVTLSGSGTTFNTNVYEWTGYDEPLELQEGLGGGTLTISGNITGDGTIILEGDGTLELSGTGNVLTHTISANSGYLTLSGGYDISAIASEGETTYAGGQHTGNGYATANGDVIVYSGPASVTDTDATYTYHGEDVTVSVAGGVYTLPGEQDNTTYYINANTDSYTWIDANKPGELTGGIVVKEGATLQADKDLNMSLVAASSKGTVQIAEGVVVSSNGGSQHVALTGKGTYALTSGAQTLGSVDASGLEGWVRLSGTITDLNLDGNLQGTNVELRGVSGYLKNLAEDTDATFAGDIHLANDGDTPAIRITNGYSRTKSEYIFTGAVSGEGTWELATPATQHYVFEGSLEDWTGEFKVSSSGGNNGGTSIDFKDAATTVNASITRTGGTLRLFADTDVTFNAAVTGTTSTTVAAGKTATFASNDDGSIGGISGTGTLVKNGTGTLTVSGAPYIGTTDDPIPATVTINVNEGTLKATTAGTLGGGSVNVASGATLEMTTGDILGGTQTVINNGNVLIHQTFTKGIINGGTLTLAGDFPTAGDILDVDDQNTGNGFSQGGSIKVYDPAEARLSTDIDIVRGDTHYTLGQLVDGTITLSGADWSIYQLNGAAQYAVQAIMDYASDNGGELKTISVNADDLELTNDSTTLKTSMLGGEHLPGFILTMADSSALEIDGNNAVSIYTAEGSSTISLTADATIGTVVAGDANTEAASTLTITGKDHTVLVDGLGVAFDSHLIIDEGVRVELLPETAFSTVTNATMELKEGSSLALGEVTFATLDGGTEASIVVTSDDYLPMYDPAFAEYSVTGMRITFDTTAAYNLGHVIDATSQIVNAGTGSLNDVSANAEYAELNAQGGNIYISTPVDSGMDTRELTVGNLTLAAGRTVGEDTGKAVSITVTGEASFGSGSTVGAALTMAGGSTLDAAAPVALADHALAIESGVTIGDALWSTISSLASETSATIFTGVSALTLNGAQYTEDVELKDIFNHADLKANKYVLGYDATGKNVTITRLTDDNRYWKGGSGSWNTTATNLWTDEEGGADAAFVNGYNAYFTSASGGVITLGADITADSITVSGADYIFSPGTYSLTVNKSVEADAHKATFNMTLSGENLKLIAKNGGTITLAKGGSVKDVEIGSGSSLEVSSATLTVADGFVNNGSLDAETLELKKGTAQGGNVDVGTLKLADNLSYTFGTLYVSDTLYGANANLTIADSGKLDAITARLQSLATGDSATLTGNITVSGATNVGGGTTLSGSLTTATLTGGPLTVEDGSLTLASGSLGNVQFSGSSTVYAGGTVTLDGALQNTGDLTLTGRFDASNLAASKSDSKYVEGGTPGNGNGFEQARLTLTIVNGGSTNGNAATIDYRGKTLTEDVDTDGRVTFNGDTDYTKFYVNSGTEKVSTAMGKFSANPGTFVLANTATLEVDQNIAMSMVTLASGAAANLLIDSGSTVTTDGTAKALTLKGEGTYALASGVSGLGVVLDDSWSGTVSFTAAQLNTLDGAWKSGSTVSLTGATGILGAADNEATIVLNKGEGDWGFGQTGDGMYSATLNGTITGDGNLGVKSGTATSIFELNGNTAAWTGNFIVATAADVTLSLGGDAKTINGSVSGSNLTLKLKTDATLKADSTVARVNATAGSLKVDAGKRLTVTNTILPDNIKLGAGASIAAAYMGGTEYGYMDGTIANETDSDQDVAINNADITVTDTTLRVNGGSGFTVDNNLVNATLSVENGLPSTVTLNNVQDSLEVAGNLEIGPDGLLKVAQNNGTAKQTLNISDGITLTLGNSTTLDADLTLNGGATLQLNYNLSTPVATTLNGGALALVFGRNGLTLDGELYNQLAGFTEADDNTVVDLFQGVGALTLDGSAYTGEVNAMQYFTNLTGLSDLGDYTLLYNDSTDTVSIRFNLSEARALTWNGTEGNSAWEVGEGTAENWLDNTPEKTHFKSGDTAKFTGDAAYKEVTIADGRTEARDITITGADAQYAFAVAGDSTLAASNLMTVSDGATLAKTGEGNLTLELPGALSLVNGTLEVQKGGLAVASITADADSSITLDGTLRVAQGSINGITAHKGSTLVIGSVGATDAGTLTVGADTTLYGLVNSGTLDVGTHSLTLTEAAAQGGNVTAGVLNLVAQNGNAFGNLKVNTIHYAYGAEGAGELGAVNVDTIAANGAFPVITLDLADTMGAGGSLAPTNRTSEAETYTLIHADGQTLSTSNFMLGGNTLALLVQNGLVHEGAGLTVTENDVKLTIGGQDLTWNTGSDTTEWGYQVMDGDLVTAGGNTLNGVEHVVVGDSRTVDVTGVGHEPGLRVRNITGAANRTLSFTGTEDDTVNLVTNEETSSNVNIAAHNITLKVGLDELDEMDPVDYKDLRVGNVNLTGATLAVHEYEELDDAFTVNSLSGDAASLLKGRVLVEGHGGAYRGGYENAYVGLHEDAEQLLYAGRGLTIGGLGIAKLAYTGAETHMDGIEGIGMTVLLNSPDVSNIGSTLVLDNASWLHEGTLVSGMSAMQSALTLDTEDVPTLVEAESLNMERSWLVINQDAEDDANIAMAIQDGGRTKNLHLANVGGSDSNTDLVDLHGYLYNKYYSNARLAGGRLLVDRRTDFYTADVVKPTTENGRTGAAMLDDALLEINPQITQANGDLAYLMSALETPGAVADPDRVAAAMSGASAAALGMAYSNDVQRQLRAIRNRTTTMGLADCTAHEDLPYVNAWVNAEGDYRKMDADTTLAGYTLSSWGGTVGCDLDLTNRLTMGAAFTVMHGNFTAHAADTATGDIDRDYVSVFARYGYHAWSHTLVGTLGYAKSKVNRTVNCAGRSYTGRDEADGNAFGIMYEVGYTKALNEDASTCLQPLFNVSYRHSSLGGYTERSQSDAALQVGDADVDAVTFGLGARLQSIVGTSVYNRATLLEGRVLFKLDAGDRDASTNSSFLGVNAKRSAKSAEMEACGVEVGAGLTIPVGEGGGALFMDVSGDFRSGYTELNGAAGYRFSF